MTALTAQDALLARLQDMPDRPTLAYPNGPTVTALPRIVVEVPSAAQRTYGGDGATFARAEIIARVETKKGKFDTEAVAIAEQIIEHFPPGLSLDGVQIREKPQPRGRYGAGGVYHIPVVIRGELIA